MSVEIWREIQVFLSTAAITPTRFGRAACGDPHLIRDVRNGRQIGVPLANRIRAYIAEASQ